MRTGALLLWACAVMLAAAALAAVGCGGGVQPDASAGGGTTTVSARALKIARRERDGDRDNDTLGLGPLDDDGDAVPTYAPVAGAAERAPMVAVLKRYFAAASSGDASAVCSVLDPVVIETMLEEQGNRVGEGCRVLVTPLLRREHTTLLAKSAALKVRLIELRARQAWAVLDFGGGQESLVLLRRRADRWLLTALREEAL